MNADEMIAYAEQLSLRFNPGDGRSDITMEERTAGGAYRDVIVKGGFAFKVAQGSYEIPANLSEWDFYCMTTDAIRKLLAKPVYISRNGRCIVMEELTPWRKVADTPRSPGYKRMDSTERALNLLCERTIRRTISDLHGGNWGVTQDGKIKCLDYGMVMYWVTDQQDPKTGQWIKVPYDRTGLLEVMLDGAK